MKKQKYVIEIITLILYACAMVLIMYYHEPWFDEAQAWLIARDATIKELLNSITHYEGHPPIWFLILMPFAKLGVPFETGIKAVNFTLATTAMGIFFFKAPFNRIIRCTIPFTYFFFYQYGVISRTYSLMMLGFVLSALFFKSRNEKPFRFIIALAVLCGASVYGIIFSAGVALVWLWEILDKSISLKTIKLFLKTKRFYALLILLIFNILLLISIYPYNDTYATNIVVQKRSKIIWIFYMFFMAPAEALCSSVFSDITDKINMYACVIISCFINLIMLEVTKIFKKTALFIISYCLFALFGGLVYFSPSHVGVLTLFYMFLLWCCFSEAPELIEHTAKYKYVKYIGLALLIYAIGISIYWSITAVRNEIALNYGTGRETAEFIKENNLTQLNIMVSWNQTIDPDTGEECCDYNYLDGIPALAYFDKNIFYNFNNQSNNKCYLLHKINVDGSRTKMLIENDYPDVLFTISDPRFTFGDNINLDDYVLVKSINGATIWKDKIFENKQFIFLRRDLLKNYLHIPVSLSHVVEASLKRPKADGVA